MSPDRKPMRGPLQIRAHAMLAAAHDLLVEPLPHDALDAEYRRLSHGYRGGQRTPRDIGRRAVAAYAAARLPATLAANVDVLGEVARLRPEWKPRSMIDMGAGLGPSAWVAADLFPTMSLVTLCEPAPEMVAAGQVLAERCHADAIRTAPWIDPSGLEMLDPADLVVASYVLGETADERAAIGRWWTATAETLVVIEPGTPAGFERVLRARSQLVEHGASIVAPCPHDRACPLGNGGWCHFSTRVPRSATHRAMKNATLGTEDEKFSYVAATRTVDPPRTGARVITKPARRGGHVRVELCTQTGLGEAVVTKSDPDYRRARNLRWGDEFNRGPQPRPAARAENHIAAFVQPHLDAANLRRVTLSRTRGGTTAGTRRAVIRPVEIKGTRMLQVVTYDDHASRTTNVADATAPELRELLRRPFGTVTVMLTDEILEARLTRRGNLVTSRTPTAPEPVRLAHDRQKRQPIPPDAPFLEVLGVSSGGQVKPSRRAKYRQINEFIRLVETARLEPRPGGDGLLRVVDLGCGNAYLTFAVHHHLTVDRGLECEVTGVDRNSQLVERNTRRAHTLRAKGIHFRTGDIATFEPGRPPNVAIALHACDTATDYALAAMVRWGSELGLVAPCCHHHLQAQLRRDTVAASDALLLGHGILRERLGDVLTDAARATVLRLLGYDVDVVEFVMPEHTPKNLLIRATSRELPARTSTVTAYRELVERWSVTPLLAELLQDRLADRGVTWNRPADAVTRPGDPEA